MALECGIVGLPNVGKSTLFTALTSLPAEASNYPFCTIEPNVGQVAVPDSRLEQMAALVSPQRVIPTTVQFIDIAGLAPGASKGEGLGNRFLARIRETNLIAHVVRCFNDPNVAHVRGQTTPDPRADLQTIEVELLLADLEAIARRGQRIAKDPAQRRQLEFLTQIEQLLSAGTPVRAMSTEILQQAAPLGLVQTLHQLLTAKRQIVVANVDEEGLAYALPTTQPDDAQNSPVQTLQAATGTAPIVICAAFEAELAALESATERAEFLQAAGLSESGLHRLIRAVYYQLGLRTFFTCGPQEVRAWTFRHGETAATAAGSIHSDFERGFICAETFHCSELFEFGSAEALKRAGKLRREGRGYRVQDGDVILFRFNL